MLDGPWGIRNTRWKYSLIEEKQPGIFHNTYVNYHISDEITNTYLKKKTVYWQTFDQSVLEIVWIKIENLNINFMIFFVGG